MIVFNQRKHLGFVNIPGKRKGVENPVSIRAEPLSVVVCCEAFGLSANGLITGTGQGTEAVFFSKV